MISYLCKNIIIPSCTSNLVILKSAGRYYIYIYNNKFYFLGALNLNEFKLRLNESVLSINIISKDLSKLPTLKISHFVNNTRFSKISKKISKFLNS